MKHTVKVLLARDMIGKRIICLRDPRGDVVQAYSLDGGDRVVYANDAMLSIEAELFAVDVGDVDDGAMNIGGVIEYAAQRGVHLKERTLRLAAARGFMPGARRIGRDWIIPMTGVEYYLRHRPKRGRKPRHAVERALA